jgi:hypothetical protein
MDISEKIDPELLKSLPDLPLEEQKEILKMLEQLDAADMREKSRATFMGFVKSVWPAFIEGRHHKIMADAFQRVAEGKLKRLIINMPPRHTKSEFASYLLPSWFLGKYPEKKIIQTAHTAELSVGFGRKVRNLVDSDDFKNVFPTVALRADSKAAGRWSTNAGGEYFAIGVGGAVTGKGADLLIIDDPHSEQEGQSADASVFDKVYEWYTSGPRQRLQPGGAIVVVMPWLSVSGGKNGTVMFLPSVSLSFSLGIPPSSRHKDLTTRLAQHGEFFTSPMIMVILKQTLSCLMPIKSDWSSQS